MAQPVETLLSTGLGHFAQGDNAAAVACWEAVLEQEPANPRAAAYLTYARSLPGVAPAAPVAQPPAQARVEPPPPPPASPPPPPPPVMAQAPVAAPPLASPNFTPPPTAAPLTPSPDPNNAPTMGRIPAVEPPPPPGLSLETADWFQEASVGTGSHPLNPAVPPAPQPPPVTPAPDPLLSEVLGEMRQAPASPVGVAARGANLFGVAADAPVAPPAGSGVATQPVPEGPWEAVMSPAPVGEPPRGAEVTKLEEPPQADANADGLQGMWAAPPSAAPAVEAVVVSPWDEGPTVSSQVVVVDTQGTQTQRVAPSKGTPNTPAPGKNAPGPMGTQQDLKARCAAMMARVRELHELGDFSGSQELVEKVLELDRANAEARDYMEKNEETLLKMYLSKLGSLEQVPRMQMSPDQIIWLNLHHKAGFLLSRVDGMSTFEDIMSLSAMPRLETVRLLAQLLATGVIAAT